MRRLRFLVVHDAHIFEITLVASGVRGVFSTRSRCTEKSRGKYELPIGASVFGGSGAVMQVGKRQKDDDVVLALSQPVGWFLVPVPLWFPVPDPLTVNRITYSFATS